MGEETKVVRVGSKKAIRRIAVLVALVFVAFAVLLATRKPVSMQTIASPLISHQAPSIDGVTLTGEKASLASYSGRFVLINFFASWCIPCQKEESGLVKFAQDHQRVGDAAVLGVAFNDPNSSALAFLKHYGATYQAVTDPNGQIALSYGVAQPPQSYLVAPNGVILTEIIGPINQGSLDQLITIAKSKGY